MSIRGLSIPTISRPAEAVIPAAVLDAVAEQVRPGGMCLVVLRPDGTVAYHDAEAGTFFDRYAVPALSQPDLAGGELRRRVGGLEAQGAVAWDLVPGTVMGAVPFVHRRKVVAVLALLGRSADFALSEDVLRLCGRLRLDATWLERRAGELAGLGSERLAFAVALVLGLVRDRVRLASMEEELNSLSTQLANAYEELTLLDQISGGMKVNRRASDFFRQACLDVMEVINVRGMGVALWAEGHRQEPALYGQISVPPAQVQRLAQRLMDCLRQRKSCLLVNDLAEDPAFGWLSEWASRLIAVPLQRQDQVLGCLFGLDKASGDFDSVDSKLLTAIANESAIYLENSMLFLDVHGLMMGLLHSLTSAVDAKDAYTCGHSERVALLARHLARLIKLPDAAVERTYMAGLLHDVGKIGVPEHVLQKNGRLTSEEFEQIKKHPQIGARILRDVKQMEDIVPGVLHHHERYDGRGYPAGLAGREIPLMGRIIGLADAFDAMTSNRTYRRALALEVALAEIRRCAGTQFDPALAEAMLQMSSEELRELMQDHRQQAKKLLELQEALRSS